MNLVISIACLMGAVTARADMNDSRDADEHRRVAIGAYANAGAKLRPRRYLVSSPADCSNAGDEVARPAYGEENGRLMLLGFECEPDNR